MNTTSKNNNVAVGLRETVEVTRRWKDWGPVSWVVSKSARKVGGDELVISVEDAEDLKVIVNGQEYVKAETKSPKA